MRVLHLEDSDADAELIARALARGIPGAKVRSVRSRAEYEKAVRDGAFDVILADYALEQYDGISAFEFAQQHCPETPFILVSGAIGEENAIDAMRRGVADYVLKDRPARLVPAIRQALVFADEKRRRRANEAEVQAGARRAELLVEVASRLFVAEAGAGGVDRALASVASGVHADAFWFEVVRGDASNEAPRHAGGAAMRDDAAAIGPIDSPDGSQPAGFPGAAALEQAGVFAVSRHQLGAGDRMLGQVVFGFRAARDYSESEDRFLSTALDLVAAHLERQRLLRDVRHALRAAEQANRAKDDFLAALSHELRTPLNPVQLLASAGATNAQWPEAARRDFATISAQVGLEARLIDDLLELTRITRNEVSLSFAEVELHDVLEDAIRTIEAAAQGKAITLSRRFGHRRVRVRGDRARLHQAFWNLLDNAVRFSLPEGSVSVSTKAEDGRIAVTIADRGIGMTPEELARAFEPFVRGEQAAREETGHGRMGLGLAITRRIVELHGGDVAASSAGPGHGARFVLRLPVPASEAAPVAEAGSAAGQEPERRTTEARRLLLVEDHTSTREALSRLLRQRGFEATAVGTVGEAQQAAADRKFDLVLSDIGLPDGNGFELMAQLHSRYGLSGIALTGFHVDQAELERAGFVGVMTKPVGIRPLVEAIGRARERRDGGSGAPGP